MVNRVDTYGYADITYIISVFGVAACDGRADIVFMIDASGSIRQSRFQVLLDYVTNVTRELEIRADRARVGVLAFSDHATVHFHLDSYVTKDDVTQAIQTLVYQRRGTNIAGALKMMRTEMFVAARGDRPEVPNYGILLSDGVSTLSIGDALPEAIEARIAGVTLIVVAVGRHGDSLELRGIASDPDERNVLHVDSFSQLDTLKARLVDSMCDGTSLRSVQLFPRIQLKAYR